MTSLKVAVIAILAVTYSSRAEYVAIPKDADVVEAVPVSDPNKPPDEYGTVIQVVETEGHTVYHIDTDDNSITDTFLIDLGSDGLMDGIAADIEDLNNVHVNFSEIE